MRWALKLDVSFAGACQTSTNECHWHRQMNVKRTLNAPKSYVSRAGARQAQGEFFSALRNCFENWPDEQADALP
jgi:hypothetical protein